MENTIYFNEAKYFAGLGESKPLFIATVTCYPKTKTLFNECIKFTVEFSDTSLTLSEIEHQAVEKAKEFIKSIANSIE